VSVDIDVGAGGTAADIAASVNSATDTTGVTADAKTQVKLSGFTAGGLLSFELNGSVVSASPESPSDVSAIATAINERAGTTGVSATITSDNAIILTDETGADITIEDFTSAGDVDVVGLNYDGTDGATSSTLTSTNKRKCIYLCFCFRG